MCLITVTIEVNEFFFPHQTQDTSTNCVLCSAEYRSIGQEYACHLIFVFPHMLLFGRNDTRIFLFQFKTHLPWPAWAHVSAVYTRRAFSLRCPV